MNWEKLKSFECPHCHSPLVKVEEDKYVYCTQCRFEISFEQYERRIKYRGTYQKPKNEIKWKWQNLHDHKCVICGENLTPSPGNRRVLKCVDSDCPFGIRISKLEEALADPRHNANRFKEK